MNLTHIQRNWLNSLEMDLTNPKSPTHYKLFCCGVGFPIFTYIIILSLCITHDVSIEYQALAHFPSLIMGMLGCWMWSNSSYVNHLQNAVFDTKTRFTKFKELFGKFLETVRERDFVDNNLSNIKRDCDAMMEHVVYQNQLSTVICDNRKLYYGLVISMIPIVLAHTAYIVYRMYV